MSNHTYLPLLNKDSLPPHVIQAFVNWCVWDQAVPSLKSILDGLSLEQQSSRFENVKSLMTLSAICNEIGVELHKHQAKTGRLGFSTAEAVAFLVAKIAMASTEMSWDPEGVAFFTAQVKGWERFAESDFTLATAKVDAETAMRTAQEAKLAELMKNKA